MGNQHKAVTRQNIQRIGRRIVRFCTLAVSPKVGQNYSKTVVYQ